MNTPNKGIHFEISERKVLLRLLDNVSIIVALYLIGYFFDFDYLVITKEKWSWILVLLLYFNVFSSVLEMYDLRKSSAFEKIIQSVIITTLATVTLYLLTPFFTPILPDNRLQILFFVSAIFIGLCIWRFAYIYFIVSPRFIKNLYVIGDANLANIIYNTLHNNNDGYNVIGLTCLNEEECITHTDILTSSKDILPTIKKNNVAEVIVAVNKGTVLPQDLVDKITYLLENGVTVKDFSQAYEDALQRLPIQYVGNSFYRHFLLSRSNQNKLYLFFSRILDILLAILGITNFILFLPIVFIGNMIANKGSLFYTQERVGQKGELFKIYKLRSMIKDAEKDGAKWAAVNDHRITPFGKFLRKSRFDEMPQFFNVLKGDMSIIGPRPERPVFVNELSRKLPYYNIRHMIKPGVTGWAQVKTEYGDSEEDSLTKLQYDLFYIKHRSIIFDFNIIIKTLSTIIFFRGR